MKIKESLEFELEDGTTKYVECLLEFDKYDEEREVKVIRLDTNEDITKVLTHDQMWWIDSVTDGHWYEFAHDYDWEEEIEDDYED